MPRRYPRHFLANLVMTLAAAVFIGACHGESKQPTTPSGTAVGAVLPLSDAVIPARDCASGYMISGVITAYQGGPLADVSVQAVPYPYGIGSLAKTDADGRYSVCGPAAPKIGLQIFGKGYATAFKYDLPARDQQIDIALRSTFEVPVGGGTVTDVIRGDDFEAGDDYFGGLCVSTACKVVDFRYNGCPCPSRVEVTLRWTDASSRLAVYISDQDVYFPPSSVPPATRYCCSAPVVATYGFNADFDRFAIGFEQSSARPPAATDSQPFELTIRPVP